MTEQVMFLPISLDDFQNILQKVVKTEIKNQQHEELQEKLLSPEQTRKLFDPEISRGTLHNWVEAGHLKKYHIGGRTWFKYSEVMSAITSLKKYSRT